MTVLQPDTTVRTTCPYCGVGCQMNLHIKDEQIYRVEAPFDSAPNYGQSLCQRALWAGLCYASTAA